MLQNAYQVIDREALPSDGYTYDFDGSKHSSTEISFIWVEMPPQGSVKLHKHPYKEIFIIEEGEACFAINQQELSVQAGQIVIVPAGCSHKFRNAGEGMLRQVDIHISPTIITQWLEE